MANEKGRKSPTDSEPSSGQVLIYKDAGLNLQVRLDGADRLATPASRLQSCFKPRPRT